MYLNVNLTTPPGDGSCTTPKTPEILNSLISLTSPPSYAHYQNQQVTGDLLSPVSTVSTPGEEVATTPLSQYSSTSSSSGSRRHYSGSSSEGGGLVGGSPGTSGGGGPLVGATPPATPDLPSPVSTVQATKTALIKEGLKHQIKSKLQAAGMGAEELLLETKVVKEEVSTSAWLTNEDAERRRRRRERNKIAATKCRNKKKEKTFILMSSLFQESELVEDQNIKLKTEIQRLTNEKINLEKLLRDPNHRSSCRHSKQGSATLHSAVSTDAAIPLVLVTPPEISDTTSTSNTAATQSSTTMSPSACTSPHYSANTSQSSLNMNDNLSVTSPSSISQSLSPVSSSHTLSPCSKTELTISCSTKSSLSLSLSLASSCLPTTSNVTSPPNNPQLTLVMTNASQNLKMSSCKSMSMSQLPHQTSSVPHSSEFTPMKCSPSHTMVARHQPYQYTNNVNHHIDSVNYSGNDNSHMGSLPHDKQYCSHINNSENVTKFQYGYPKMEPTFTNNEFTPPNPPTKNNYLTPKSRAANMARYQPYNCAGRLQNIIPLDSHNNPQQMRGIDNMDAFDQSNGCGQHRLDSSYISDQQQSLYYPYL